MYDFKNMEIRLVTVFLSIICLSVGVFAAVEDEIKRSTYPFMAFIYYQDETVLDLSGDRFLQGAVLIRPTFLISSSPESTISDDPLSKTLLARLGATVIDSKISLNEDEDEQEQEVIQITRPYQHNRKQWWLTDICLLKTLQPITPTKSVRFTKLSTKMEPEDKLCQIVVFKKKTGTDVRVLTSMYVEMLPGNSQNCGDKFVKDTMTCATDQANAEDQQISTDFCHGNSGGPLICDTDVMGLQTYINGECSPPHLYQLLAPRKQFLDCGIDEKCDDKGSCKHVCSVIHKDVPPTTKSLTKTTQELTTSEMTSETEAAQTTEQTETSEKTQTTEPDDELLPNKISNTTTNVPTATSTLVMNNTESWPPEREGRKSGEDGGVTRRANAEAQKQGDKPLQKVKIDQNGSSRLVVFQSLIYNCFVIWFCFI